MPPGEAVQDRKLFIGGLAAQTDDVHLRDYFSKWGDIVDVVVMKDNSTGRSRGFGFVTYSESSMAEKAVADGPHTIDGKSIDTKRAVSKDSMDDKSSGPTDKVFVGGLNKEITDNQLREYFEQFGDVKEATVMTDKDTGESRCFAFVVFAETNTVEKVMQSKPHNLVGCQIDVQKAVAREQMRKKSGFSNQPTSNRRFQGGGGGGSGHGHSRNNYGGGYDSYGAADPYYDPYAGNWGSGYYPPHHDPYYGGYYETSYYAPPYGDHGPDGGGAAGGPMRGHYGGAGYASGSGGGGGGRGGRNNQSGKPRNTPYGRL